MVDYIQGFRPFFTQPLDCTVPDVLDLCVRKKCRSPSPIHRPTSTPSFSDPPTAMCFSSPVSQAESESSETSLCSETMTSCPISMDSPQIQKAKIPRPFKAYPKDPLSLNIGVVAAEAVLGGEAQEAYVEFRKRMLSQVQNQNQGTNVKMRRTSLSNNPHHNDPTYWEKRRKNNEAAKRSRDARRAKEDEIAIRCAFLEQENLKLKYEVAALRNENERFRTILYN